MTYTPEDVGHYTVSVKYAGQEVPNAPFHVNAVPSGNASLVRPASESRIVIIIGRVDSEEVTLRLIKGYFNPGKYTTLNEHLSEMKFHIVH